MELSNKAAYLQGLVDGLGVDESTKEGKIIKAMSALLAEMAEALEGMDEDLSRAYDQINDLSDELEDLEADLYEDEDDDEDEGDEDEDDEFYLEDLIGFAVTCTEAGADGAKGAAAFTGSVTDYYDSDANPLFELEIGGRTVLVPAAEEFIAHIDFGGRTMKLVLPEGLLDL